MTMPVSVSASSWSALQHQRGGLLLERSLMRELGVRPGTARQIGQKAKANLLLLKNKDEEEGGQHDCDREDDFDCQQQGKDSQDKQFSRTFREGKRRPTNGTSSSTGTGKRVLWYDEVEKESRRIFESEYINSTSKRWEANGAATRRTRSFSPTSTATRSFGVVGRGSGLGYSPFSSPCSSTSSKSSVWQCFEETSCRSPSPTMSIPTSSMIAPPDLPQRQATLELPLDGDDSDSDDSGEGNQEDYRRHHLQQPQRRNIDRFDCAPVPPPPAFGRRCSDDGVESSFAPASPTAIFGSRASTCSLLM